MTQEILVVNEVEQLTQISNPEQLIEVQVVHELLEVSGPPGPEGPPGPGGSSTYTGVAAEALGGHRVVINSSAGLAYADASVADHAVRVVGVTLSAAVGGQPVPFQSSGKITEPSWSWTPDADIFLGLNGLLTQSIPGTAVFAQRLGFALSPTEMWVELGEPIIF
jgi:hypothetical protein